MDNIKLMIKAGDLVGIARFVKDNNLVMESGKLVPRDSQASITCKSKIEFYDKRQLALKILKI